MFNHVYSHIYIAALIKGESMRTVILALGLVVGLTNALADSKISKRFSRAEKDTCMDLQQQRSAVSAAQDWPVLERRAKQDIKTCRGAVNSVYDALMYSQLSMALRLQGRPKEALAASEGCLLVNYADVGCHTAKVFSLIDLKQMPQAKRALDTTAKIIEYGLKQTEENLARSSTFIEREMYGNNKEAFEIGQRTVNFIKAQYFPD